MIIQIKMDINRNYTIKNHFKSYIVVIILVIYKQSFELLHFPPRVYSIM